jgi:hydrogenase/urease accessory protein HupE
VTGLPGIRSRFLLVAFGTLAGALLPAPVEAHLVTTGLGPIYDGISHVLLSPEDLVPVLAMALLAGQNGPTAGRRTLFALTGAWLLGGLGGLNAGQFLVPGGVTAASFLVLGGLTAADRRLSATTVAGLAVILGLLHGWLNGAGIAEAGREALALAGIVTAIFVLVAMGGAAVVSMRAGWARVAVRVAGSWVAAIGLLMLGWGLRGPV